MKLLLAGAAALAMAMPIGASAQSASKPAVYLIKDGFYSCTSCSPAIKVRADNIYYPVKGHPNFDSVAISLTSNGITETFRKDKKVVSTATTTVSVNGRTATTSFTNGKAKGVTIARRIAPAPKGAHPLSGSWETVDSSGAAPLSQ
jgi:hypothetical protein